MIYGNRIYVTVVYSWCISVPIQYSFDTAPPQAACEAADEDENPSPGEDNMRKLLLFALLLCGPGVFRVSAQVTPTATPTFSPAASAYSSAQTVSISTATPSATIYYTTNGTTPTTNSTVYSGPILVSASARVEAIATANGLSTSAVGSAAYTIGTVIAPSCSGMSLGNGASLNGFIPFPSINAWNTNIVSASVDPNSATIVTAPGFAGWYLHPDFGAESSSGIPYVVVDSTATPTVSLNVIDSASQSDVVVAPYPITAPIQGNPADCSGWPDTYNGDAHVLVLDRAQCELYETYNTHRCNGQWAASSQTIWDLHNYESRPWGWNSADAAGLSVFPGLVRYDEIASGAIKHALRFSLEQTRNDANNGYFVSPATHAAGNNSTTSNVMGMRIRLKAGFDISGFSPVNQVILTAMQQYGLILTGNGGNFYFQGAPDPRFDDNDLANLEQIASSNFEVVQTTPELPGYDSATAPTGAAPTINSFTASTSSVSAGSPVTLNYNASGDSYDYVDMIGPITGGAVTFTPTQTTTYVLNSTNAYGRSVSTPITVTVPGSVVAAPTFTPAAGTYSSSQAVTINTPTSPSATIYYTTNGTTPTTSSTQYSGPITVSSTQTLQAIATVAGYSAPSAVGSAAYTLGSSAEGSSTTTPVGGGTIVYLPAPNTAIGTITITGCSNTNPIVVTAPNHGLSNGAAVWIDGIAGNTNCDGFFQVGGVTANTFTLANYLYFSTVPAGNGTFASAGNPRPYATQLTAYTLTAHPRVMLDGPSGPLTASISNTSNKASGSNPIYTSLQTIYTTSGFNTNYNTAGIDCFSYTGGTGMERYGDMAMLWMAGGQTNSTYLTMAKYGVDNFEQIVCPDTVSGAGTYGFICSTPTAFQCGRDDTQMLLAPDGSTPATAINYDMIYSQLTSAEKSNFADKIFNDNALFRNTNSPSKGGGVGGIAGDPTTSCTPWPANTAWNQSAHYCGWLWYIQHEYEPAMEAPGQEANYGTDYEPTSLYDTGGFPYAANHGSTHLISILSLSLALADDDPRARSALTELMVWYFKWRYPWNLSSWTGMTENGARYQQFVDNPQDPAIMLMLNHAISGYGTALTHTGDNAIFPLETYGVLPDGGAGAGYGSGQGPYTLDQWLDPTGVNSNSSISDWTLPILGMSLLHPASQYVPYTYWMMKNFPGSPFSSGWSWQNYQLYNLYQYIEYDPTISTTNINTLPAQYLFKDTAYSACQTYWGSQTFSHSWTNGTPAVDTPGCYPNMSYQMAISKSDWTGTATQLWMSASWGSDNLDRSGGGQYGAYHIYRNGYLLAGNSGGTNSAQASASAHNLSGIYASGLASDMVIEIGGVDNWNVMKSNANVSANFARWASTDPSGDSASRYVYSMIDLRPTYIPAANVTRANRHIIHFKKASAQDYIVSYDDVALSSSNQIQAWWHYFLPGNSGLNTVSVNTSALTVTDTLSSGNGKLLTSFLPVQGASTVALVSNGANKTTWDTYTCPSANGSSCVNAISGEWIAVHQPCNGTSCTMPTLTQPSCSATGGSCTALQIADASNPKVAVFARQGVTLTAASFTTTHGGTGQYLIAGMAPGNYNVSVNGATVASSISVNANDNTLYFESTAGLVQIESSGTLALAATPSFTPAAGTFSSAQTVAISTTTPSATIYYTTDGSTPTTSSSVYAGPITVSATETLQALAVATGYSNSTVGSAAYTITSVATTPTFTPAAGTYNSTQTVTISTTTPSATLYYTTNGSTPTTSSAVYSGPITVSATETLRAIAVAPGYSNSTVGSAAYTITSVAATPSFTPAAGIYSSTQTVTISATTPSATLYYTTNGSTPTTSSAVYSGPVTVSATETLQAIAVAPSYSNSTVGSAAYTITSAAATTTSLTATPNPVATGQTLTLTATVKGTGSTAPGGTVDFLSGSTPLGTAPVNPSGVATLTLTTLAIGTYSVTGQYSGNANFLSSTSAVVSVAVGNQATTTSLIASPNPVATGQMLTLTATVQGTGSTAPGGTVSFLSGSTLLGTATLNSSGVASLTTSSLAAGTYSLNAQYAGNASFFASTSATASVTVSAQATTTTTSMTASPNPVATGQTLILTANVQGTGSTAPGGTVSFLSGSTPLGSATLSSSGVATLTLTTLAVGTYGVTAQYAGDANFLSSTSAAASVTVSSQPATTTTSLIVFPNPVATGQTLTLTATVPGSGSTVPAGIVSFLSGSTPLGTAALNSSGVATLTLTTLAIGTYSVTAQYSGSASFPSSTSAAVSVTVSSQATTTSLTATPNPVTTGQATTLTATVQGPGAPYGLVSFLNGSTLLGTGTLNSSGVATLTTTLPAAGTFSLTAQYAGDANLLASTSAAVSLTVNAPVTTADLAFSLNATGSALSQTVQPGTTAVFTLNVSPAPGTTLPAITLTASGLPQGYTATFSPPTIAAGSGATNVTLTIQVPAQTAIAMLERERKLRAGLSVLAFCILLLPFGGRLRRSGKRMLQLSGMVLLLFGLASVMGLAGCTAPPGQFSGQNAQTYTITVTTTSASQSQTANVTLIVE